MEIGKKVTRDPELLLVTEVKGAIVGSIVGGCDGRRGLIYHSAIATPLRSHGIGSRSMNEVETGLQARGCLKFF
jgi:ribosomal protein S18 acetylase RimI-like enzyme